jgi:transcriptional/translational regulatory protein YebC/TACO1
LTVWFVGKLPKDRIEKAIQRGQGVSMEGVALQSYVIEALGPGSVAIIMWVPFHAIARLQS